MNNTITYYLAGQDLRTLGVYVASSRGIVDRPKPKAPRTIDWADEHGTEYYPERLYLEERKIELNCFIEAPSKTAFLQQLNQLYDLLGSGSLCELRLDLGQDKVLVYYVYPSDAVSVTKDWSETQMHGTFTLKLTEPEPLKRILKFVSTAGQRTIQLSMQSPKTLTIHWGDGTSEYLQGSAEATHQYQGDGTFYPCIAGDIELIKQFQTNANTLWNKL